MDWNKILLLAFLLSICSISKSQNITTEIDSIKILLKNEGETYLKADSYNDIAWRYLNIDLTTSKSYADSSFNLSNKLKYTKRIEQSNYLYAVWHRKSGNYDIALDYIITYQTYIRKEKDSFNMANAAYQKGVIFGSKGNYEKCLESYYESLDLFEHINDKKSVGLVLNSIGIIQKNLKNYPKAIESYERCIDIYKQVNYTGGLSNTYGNLGNVYAITGNYDKAIVCFRNSLKIDEQNQNNWGIAINKMDIAKLYLEQKKYDEAIRLLEEAYEIQNKYGFKKELLETTVNLGEAHRLKKNYDRSEFYLKNALSQNTTSIPVKQNIHYQLYILNQEQGKYRDALNNYKYSSNLKDSIYSEANLKSINDLQIKYESKVKDEEIANQKLILNQKEKNFQLAILGSSLLLITSLGIWLFYRQQQKLKNEKIEALTTQRELNKLESFIEGEEKERKRIAQDLHDGINGDLSVIKYKITSIDQNNLDEKEIKEFDAAVTMLDNTIEQVRHISQNLVPPSLQNFNLTEAIMQLCSKMEASSTSKIDFQDYGNYLKLNTEAETAIYRIIQELIYNTIKHANATEVLVQLNNHKNQMHLTVEDNGNGFDLTKNYNGIGLKNIESRISFLEAEMNIDSSKNGTTVTIEINTNSLKR